MTSDLADNIELRVLYGSQAGSNLPLAVTREYLLGNSAQCAVMLSGPRIAGEHALIRFKNGQPFVSPVDGQVCDSEGKRIEGERALALGDPVELGGIWISIDYAASLWPEVDAIPPKATVPPPASTTPVAPKEKSEARAIPVSSSNRGRKSNTSNTLNSTNTRYTKSRSKFSISKMIATLCLLIVSGSVLAAWFYGDQLNDSTTSQDITPSPPHSLITAISAKEVGGNVSISADSHGGWLLNGYVPTHENERALYEALQHVMPRPRMNIRVEDDLVEEGNAYLAKQSVQGQQFLHVENGGSGKLLLIGAAATATIVTTTEKALLAKIQGLRSVESNVALPTRLLQLLKEKLNAAGFTGRLSVVKEEPVVILKGDLTNEEIERWQTLFIDFCRTYGSVLPIDASVGGEMHTVTLDVRTIVGGLSPYVVTSLGERINVGGTINGRTIVAIRDGIVTFDGNEQLKSIR